MFLTARAALTSAGNIVKLANANRIKAASYARGNVAQQRRNMIIKSSAKSPRASSSNDNLANRHFFNEEADMRRRQLR